MVTSRIEAPRTELRHVQNAIAPIVSKLAARDTPRTEATVQADVRQLLLTAEFDLEAGDVHEVTLESPVGDRRRIDVEIGATVIEVKKDLRVGNLVAEAITQLGGYVAAREHSHGGRWVGILTDGADWRCYHLRDGQLREVSTFVAKDGRDAEELVLWLEGVLATARDLKPTPQQIRARLGVGSSAHALDRATIAALYEQSKTAAVVATKRRLWARLLETALGTQFQDSDDLFVEHTLLVNTAEIVAHAVLGVEVTAIPPHSLLSGAKFDEAGVFGVVEADFFDWVVDIPRGDEFVRALARRVGRFDWSAVEHDVLKVLYESVIAAETRKRLGEYYTPDWLAEKVVETAVTAPLDTKVLDPACGSGTFIFHAVRRYLDAATAANMTPADMLDGVTHHVFGMDLHPVAVTLARVTYLLAIGRERLAGERREIRVPIFLGDSMQWRKANPSLFSAGELTVPVDDKRELTPSEFRFPSSLLKNARAFDDLVAELADLASRRQPGAKIPSLGPVFQRHAVAPADQAIIAATFKTMCRLHDEGRDHIWGYYIRNLARPEWLSRPENRADVLIGNPPWLSFRFMPGAMQADFRQMSEARRLWHGQKVATHQDLSALFVVRSLQLYLKPDGAFAFVMPSGVLDRGQYKGFREAIYDDPGTELRAAFTAAWDLRELRPHFFPITASVVFGRRTTKAIAFPNTTTVWAGRLPAGRTAWADVEPQIQRESVAARQPPVATKSPYHARFRQGATIVPRVLFMVEKLPVGPLGTVANKAPVRSARSANEKKPWKNVTSLTGSVETEFIYRTHLGETVLPFRTLDPVTAVLPIDKRSVLDGDERVGLYPGLADWWTRANECWQKHRSSDRLELRDRLDYHRELSVQLPLAPQRVVYSKSGMHLAAARVTDHRAVIDHTLYWAAVSSAEEGYFLCAILNAATVTTLVRPMMAYSKDERHIDKVVWSLRIPLFDAANAVHGKLALLAKVAEAEIAKLQLDGGKHFAASRRAIRAWLETSDVGRQIEETVKDLLEP